MLYDQLSIDLAREAGAPDPEGNVKRANEILMLLNRDKFAEARQKLAEITDPVIAKELLVAIEFDETCRCIR